MTFAVEWDVEQKSSDDTLYEPLNFDSILLPYITKNLRERDGVVVEH